MNVVRSKHTFLQRGRLYPARSDVPYFPGKKPTPTGGDTSAKQLMSRPIPPKDRTTNDWTAIAWPTNIQSKTPDGKFGPVKQMDGWGDCWFLAPLAAVANDKQGKQILAESIKKVNGGYDVTFKGSPNNTVYIADAELQALLETQGGDADTRLMELAADKFFNESGNFKSLFIASLMNGGMNQEGAEQCLQTLYSSGAIQDPMTYNPMRSGISNVHAFFMFTGLFPDYILAESDTAIQDSDVMRFLNRHVTNDRDGASVVIGAVENPLGDGLNARMLVALWDAIRTEITSNGTVDPQQRAFLNALDKWLETRDGNNLEALASAAGNLKLEHNNPVEFVYTLAHNQFDMNEQHFNLLRSGVREVLGGGCGYIGFPGNHSGTIEGINEATNTFTYWEPVFSTLVHSGELSGLIQAVKYGNVYLNAVGSTTGQDEAESSHAGEKRGRHLREIHRKVVGDGKIDPIESGSLANLMEMDEGAFWQLYDSDKNGVIEAGELKAVELRVDRWVDHFELTPIW